MIYKLHYWFMSAGANAMGVLLGVYVQHYTDANHAEIGGLYMIMPLAGLIFRPLICSKADRGQAHQKYLILCNFMVAVSYAPFVIIPLLGPDIYRVHARTCWYLLIVFKVVGDIAFGGVLSIGDALTINYAKRIGVEFSVYRVWGTISWMVFGVVIGQINETPYLPKYVPAFIILVISSLIDMVIVWLWPREYFKMIPESQVTEEVERRKLAMEQRETVDSGRSENPFTKSLMPREVVLAHMKQKLLSLLTCSCMHVEEPELEVPTIDREVSNKSNKLNGLARNISKVDKSGNDIETGNSKEPPAKDDQNSISKMTQVRILLLLLKRDPRIILYLLFFVLTGYTLSPSGFLFMSISERCHDDGVCDFSLLGGLLQVSTAIYEVIMFLMIRRILNTFGRVNTCALAFLMYSFKTLFFATIWLDVDPYWALVFEGFRGAACGIYLTMMSELGYKFSNEVHYIIPELIETGMVDSKVDSEKLNLALSSTMQSLIASAMDGVGRASSSLIYGFILHYYGDYTLLWRIISCGLMIAFLTIELINLADHVFKFELGLDVAAEKRRRLESSAKAEESQRQIAVEA